MYVNQICKYKTLSHTINLMTSFIRRLTDHNGPVKNPSTVSRNPLGNIGNRTKQFQQKIINEFNINMVM